MSNKKVRGEIFLNVADKEELERLAKGTGEDAQARVRANILLAYSAGKTFGRIKADFGVGTGDVRRCLKMAIDHGVRAAVSGQVPQARKPRRDYKGMAKYAACFLVLESTQYWPEWAKQKGLISASVVSHLELPVTFLSLFAMVALAISFSRKYLARHSNWIGADGKYYREVDLFSATVQSLVTENPGHANETSIMNGESARDFRRRIARMEKKRAQRAP